MAVWALGSCCLSTTTFFTLYLTYFFLSKGRLTFISSFLSLFWFGLSCLESSRYHFTTF
ncbi:hypothetical protein B0T09DRAFT_350919, partial [Sordaria sp. MPI-SDFR-AT-0083]